jgi:hypothetical protein
MYLSKQAPRNVALVVIKGIMMSNYEIEICDNVRKISYWCMNKRFFNEIEKRIKRIWEAQPPKTFLFSKQEKMMRFYKTLCKFKVVEFCVKVTSIQHELEEARDIM